MEDRREGLTHTLVPFDALYVPRDATVEIEPGPSGVDLAEISRAGDEAPSRPVRLVRSDSGDPGLHFKAGGPSAQRSLNVLIGKTSRRAASWPA